MTKAQIIDAVVRNARDEIGTREIGSSNRGKQVDEYQRADLLPGLGYPWCASFFGWDLLDVLGQTLCDRVWYRSASCDQILYWGRRQAIVSSTPSKGCAGLVMASKNDATHIFMVDEVDGNYVKTIEGNTNDNGSRNGNGVYALNRKISGRLLWLNWSKLIPEGATLPGHKAPPPQAPIIKNPFEGCPTSDLFMGGEVKAQLPKLENQHWFLAKRWAKWMNTTIAWQGSTQSVLIDGREVPAQPLLIDGDAWLPIAKLAAHNGLLAAFDANAHTVTIGRPSVAAVDK